MTEDGARTLRAGISGFGGAADGRWDLRRFKAACHAAVRAIGGAVLECEGPSAGRNHYRALVELAGPPGRRVWILLNAMDPVLAFARPGGDLRYAFTDEPGLAGVFHGPCEPVPAAELAAPLDLEAAAPRLAEVERAQARYWRPERVGDLVFNHWD